MKIKIYGYGWVGKAMKTLFPDALIHDPAQGMVCEEKCDVAFVCVPTPLKDGELDTSIVEDVIRNSQEDLIIVRSTVMPGTCDKFPDKNVVFQPEYLGETVAHPMSDQKDRQFIVIGGSPENRKKVIDLYQTVYNANIIIRQVAAYEAEIIKLVENRAISFKVMQCQELYDVCEKAGVDYNLIREAVYDLDPRFNLWFTFVYKNNRGVNSSKCLRKDVPAFVAWAKSLGYDAKLTKTLVDRSNEYERERP
jgi:UDPglucose 6-dehydrogenase